MNGPDELREQAEALAGQMFEAIHDRPWAAWDGKLTYRNAAWQLIAAGWRNGAPS